METSDREMLEQTYRLERENNKMLRGMRRNAFWGGLFKLIFWAIFLIGPVWLYYQYADQYVKPILNAYAQMQSYLPHSSSAGAAATSATPNPVESLIQTYGAGMQKYLGAQPK